MKQKLIETKGGTDNSTIAGDSNTLLSTMDKTTRQKQGKRSLEQHSKPPAICREPH